MENGKWRAAVVTLSDKGYRGERVDKSGPAVCEMLREAGYDVQKNILLPDERSEIEKCLCKLCDDEKMNIIFTTGGTGFSPRDLTPEATAPAIQRPAPGIAEGMRYHSLQITPKAMLSRATAGIRAQTLIVNLPGSPKAVRECLEYILPPLAHGLEILTGQSGNCARTEERT